MNEVAASFFFSLADSRHERISFLHPWLSPFVTAPTRTQVFLHSSSSMLITLYKGHEKRIDFVKTWSCGNDTDFCSGMAIALSID